MRDLTPVAHARVFQFDEISDAAVVPHEGGGAQAGERSDRAPFPHAGVAQVTALDARSRADKAIFHDAVARDLRVLPDDGIPPDDRAAAHRGSPAKLNGEIDQRALLHERAALGVIGDALPRRKREHTGIIRQRKHSLRRIAPLAERAAAFQIAAAEAHAPRMHGEKARDLFRRQEGIDGIEHELFARGKRAVNDFRAERVAHTFQTIFPEQVKLVILFSAESKKTALYKIDLHISHTVRE